MKRYPSMIIQGKIRNDNPESFTDQEIRDLSGTRGMGLADVYHGQFPEMTGSLLNTCMKEPPLWPFSRTQLDLFLISLIKDLY